MNLEPMLSADTRELLRAALAKMDSSARLVLFTQAAGGEGCGPSRDLVRELASLTDRLAIEARDLRLDRDAAAAYRIDRAPAIAVVGDRDRGIRFVGAPGGYEIMALVDAILLVSSGDSGLAPSSRALLAKVRTPLDIQVFATPT